MEEMRWLLADIGGTNARFALAAAAGPGFSEARVYNCADFPSVYDAIERYLDDVGAPRLSLACIAAAGPVTGRVLNVTNNHWAIDADRLQSAHSLEAVDLINDFEAVAHALPALQAENLQAIGSLPLPTLGDRDFTVAAVGPGTGLGTAGLKRQGRQTVAIVAEGGHAGFAARTSLQAELQSYLLANDGEICLEQLLSGPGIERLYRTLGTIRRQVDRPLSAGQIFSAGLDNDDDLAAEAVALFFEILGQAAGDLALTLGAWDGVYIAGGIAARYPDALRASRFREGFERKGDYRRLMQRIPTALVTLEKPGLLGASRCALARYHKRKQALDGD